jgi:hypothetical protein
MNKTFKTMVIAMVAFIGIGLTSCGDANEYKDYNDSNLSWTGGFQGKENTPHPEELTGTTWVRAAGMKTNAYGEEVQGFVESLNFLDNNTVVVKMSQGKTAGTWVDDSNNEDVPTYVYSYNSTTGTFEILKRMKDEKGNWTTAKILIGVAVSGNPDGITVVHYGDVPVQTYLVKQ